MIVWVAVFPPASSTGMSTATVVVVDATFVAYSTSASATALPVTRVVPA
jgi:hypothetical protein